MTWAGSDGVAVEVTSGHCQWIIVDLAMPKRVPCGAYG